MSKIRDRLFQIEVLDYSKRRRYRGFKYDVDSISELCSTFEAGNIDYAFCGFYAAKMKALGMTDQVTLFLRSIQDLKKALKMNSRIARPDEEFVVMSDGNYVCEDCSLHEEVKQYIGF